ncbi:MAG: NAD(P)H-dependent oxidoreductase subunit E [Nitrospirae bacterium]|nr:NAD(P)H-dependent oxidoreductase subunit E [Nitrospirota bacterium]
MLQGGVSMEGQLEGLDDILAKYYQSEGSIVSILQDMEVRYGYIPEEAVAWVSERTGLSASRFYGVATFYGQFHLVKPGKNIVKICRGTACHVKGSEKISDDIRTMLHCGVGETTPDGNFTVEHVACVGACARAPIFIVGKDVYGKMTPQKAKKTLEKYMGGEGNGKG